MIDEKRQREGWTAPQRSLTTPELEALIEEKRLELVELQRTLAERLRTEKLIVVAQIRNIMRAHDISPGELEGVRSNENAHADVGRLPNVKRVRSARIAK